MHQDVCGADQIAGFDRAVQNDTCDRRSDRIVWKRQLCLLESRLHLFGLDHSQSQITLRICNGDGSDGPSKANETIEVGVCPLLAQ